MERLVDLAVLVHFPGNLCGFGEGGAGVLENSVVDALEVGIEAVEPGVKAGEVGGES